MSVYIAKRIRCNECNYEYPNDYYFGVRNWIEVFDSTEEEFLHFCTQDCLDNYRKYYHENSFINIMPIENINRYLIG